ncbi:M56 family metallopeptidase [Adhaeribacter swui]|uniref:M56 family metallopeptidase n=1 Tax=Adhaeribacter swui TaxID=2086471 RepID=A0A7G7GA29_9BACT|nr:M56 family metallopeptidase [Adhaeribacter swui]QNF34013.1 M56 family metallopeptidase [Adhaeribacter swui]
MIEFLLKASFALTVVFLFYKLILQQESFFALNRFYLLAGLGLAFVLPFVALPALINHQGYLTTAFQSPGQSAPPTWQVTEVPEKTAVSPEVSTSVTIKTSVGPEAKSSANATSNDSKNNFSGWFWLGLLYLFGVGIFALNLVFQVGSLFYQALKSEDKVNDGEAVIVNTSRPQAPCSFFKFIFIYPNNYDFATYEQILAHEKIHVRLKHSLDLLLAEVAVIVLWFNPVAWWFKREIEKNNEYQTDAALLQTEPINPQEYQFNLLQIAVPNKPLSITTNYNQSLLKQRIKMMNAKKSTASAYWKYSFLVPLFFGTVLIMNEPATSQELPFNDILLAARTVNPDDADLGNKAKPTRDKEPASEPDQPKNKQNSSIRYQQGDVDMAKGYWYSHQDGTDYCLELKGGQRASSWNMSECFSKKLFQKTGNAVYSMTNEVGTLQLNGNLEAEVSQGKYTFTENSNFKKYLAANNLVADDRNLLFHLFFANVNRAYVDFLKNNYAEVTGERLLESAIHNISMSDHQSYLGMFQQHSHKKPTLGEVIEAKIHGIDQKYVQEIEKMGFKDLSMKKMMEAKIHGVNAAYVADLKKTGITNLPMNKVIEAKIHNINPESVKALRALGFGELSLDNMMQLNIHGVDADYIKELQAAGLKNLTLDQTLQARIHNLGASTVKAIRDLGSKDLDFEQMVNAQIHGVNAAYIADLKKAGFQNVDLDKMVEAKIHDIDGNFIAQARKKGYNFNSLDKYITLKIHDGAIKALKD